MAESNEDMDVDELELDFLFGAEAIRATRSTEIIRAGMSGENSALNHSNHVLFIFEVCIII